MENEKTAIQQIEELQSFDPVLYTEGRSTYIFAKQNNKLFRIKYSLSKPSFFVLSPNRIELMSMDDIFSILENYKGKDNDDLEEKFAYLIDLHKKFAKAIEIRDSKQAPFLYGKTCDLVVKSPEFSRIHKVHRSQAAAAQKKEASPALTPLPQKKHPQQTIQQKPVTSSAPAPKATPAPAPKPIQHPQPQAKPVATPPKKATQPQQPVVQPKPVVTPAPTPIERPSTATPTERRPWIKPTVVDLISKPGKKNRTEHNGAPRFTPWATIGTPKPQPKLEPAAQPEPVQAEPIPQMAEKTIAQIQTPTAVQEVLSTSISEKSVEQVAPQSAERPAVQPTPSESIAHTPVAENTSEQVGKAPVSAAAEPTPEAVRPTPQKPENAPITTQPIQKPQTPVETPQAKPTPRVVFMPKPQHTPRVIFDEKEKQPPQKTTNTFQLSDTAKSVLESTFNPSPKTPEAPVETPQAKPTTQPSVVKPVSTTPPATVEIYDGYRILNEEEIPLKNTKIPTPEQVTAVLLPDAVIQFYNTQALAPNFQFFQTINMLKIAIALGARDLKHPDCLNFDFSPRLFDNQHIMFKQGDEQVSLSLNANQPASFIRNVKTGKMQKLTWEEIENILNKLARKLPGMAYNSIRQKFEAAHKSKAFQPIENYPTPQQAVEEHALSTILTHKQITDMPATLCSGRIIMARYGNKYFKAVLSGVPIFEVYQNGTVSPMTWDEINKLHDDLRLHYPSRRLQEYKATTIKNLFAEAQTRRTKQASEIEGSSKPTITVNTVNETPKAPTNPEAQPTAETKIEQPTKTTVKEMTEEAVTEPQPVSVHTTQESTKQIQITPVTEQKTKPLTKPAHMVKADPTLELSEQIETVNIKQPRFVQLPQNGISKKSKPIPTEVIATPGQHSLAQAMEDADFFYTPDKTRPDFRAEKALHELRLQYAAQNPSVKVAPITPLIDEGNVLYHQIGDITYTLSLDAENPLFIKLREKFTWPIREVEIAELLNLLIEDSKKATHYIQYFTKLYNAHKKRTVRRPRKELPSIQQVLETAYYKSLLAGSTSMLNIEPVICSGNIIAARYGDVFYKITLDKLTCGAYENGEIRQMTEDEIRQINRFLLYHYSATYLMKKGANDLLMRSKKAGNPLAYFLNTKTAEKTELDTFIETFKSALKQPETMVVPQPVEQQKTSVSFEEQIREAFSFWPETETLGDWEHQKEIETLYQSLPEDIKQTFTPLQFPYLAQNDCLFYPKENNTYILSLQPEKPYYRRVNTTQNWRKMGQVEFHNILLECLSNVPEKDALIKQLDTLFSGNWYTPSFELPEMKTYPSIRQVLALTYMQDLFAGKTSLSDISVTLCNNRCACAKKGQIFYKIVLETPYTFTALQNGETRLMTLDEVQTIYRELQQKYGLSFLQKRGIRPFLDQYKKEAKHSSDRFDTAVGQSIQSLFDFNTHEQLITKTADLRIQLRQNQSPVKNDDNKIFIQEGRFVSPEEFWQEERESINARLKKEINVLKQQVEPTIAATEPFITSENYLYFEDSVSEYYIHLDFERPTFLKQRKHSKTRIPIPINKIKEMVSEWFQDDLKKRNLILQKIAAIWDRAQTPKDYKHGLPGIQQVVEINRYKKMGTNSTDTDLPATICLNDTVIARHGNVYYKLLLSSKPRPLYMRLENGVVTPMSRDELINIHRELAYRYTPVVLTRFGLSQKNLLQEYQTPFTPFIYKPYQKQSATETFWQAISQSPVEPATIEKTEALFGYLTAEPKTIIEQTPFIEDESQLPDWSLLYQTELLKHKLAFGPKAPEEDLTILPVLCSDKRIHYKEGDHEHTFSLDTTNPFFSNALISTRHFSTVSMQKVREIIALLKTTPEMQKKLESLCEAVYKEWQNSKDKYIRPSLPAPRFDQTVEFLTLTAELNGQKAPDDLPLIICNNRVLYTRQNDIYYKIRLTEPFIFEALEGNTLRIIRPDEFERIMQQAQRPSLKRQIPFRKIRPAFEEISTYQQNQKIEAADITVTTTFTLPTPQETAEAMLAELSKINERGAINAAEKQKLTNLMPRLKQILAPASTFPELAAFYDYENNLMDFKTLYQIEVRKRAIANQNPDLDAPENHDFDIAPIYMNDDRIHYKKGVGHTLISLDPERPFFSRRTIQSPIQASILLKSAQEILIKATQSDLTLQQDVLSQLSTIYTTYFARRKGRGKVIYTHPRFDQLIELENLNARLEGRSPRPNIEPTVCSGGLLCAKYGDVYYKISLNDDPIFEVFENGTVRDMRAKEFNRILQDVTKNHIHNYLEKYKISSLKPAFYRKQEVLKKQPKPKPIVSVNTFIGTPETSNHLPTFNQLLTGKKEAIDIAATHCADNGIYARKNGIYYKITLPAHDTAKTSVSQQITFEALESGVKREMNRAELNAVLNDLCETYDEQYVTQMRWLDLPDLFDTNHQQETILEHITPPGKTPEPAVTESKTTIEPTEVVAPEPEPAPAMVIIPESKVVVTPEPIAEPEVVAAPEPIDKAEEADKAVELLIQDKELMPAEVSEPHIDITIPAVEDEKTAPAPIEKTIKFSPFHKTAKRETNDTDQPMSEPQPVTVPEQTIQNTTPVTENITQPKPIKRKGRPKGSKNKPKQPAPATTQQIPPTPPAPPIKQVVTPTPVQPAPPKPAEPVKITEQAPLPEPKSIPTHSFDDLLRPEDIPEYHPSKFKPKRNWRRKEHLDDDEEELLMELNKETDLDKARNLLFPTKTMTLLTPASYPKPTLPTLPEGMKPLPHDDFFTEPDCLPDFETLYATLIYDARRELGLRQFPQNEDIKYFDMEPILCNDHILFYKKGANLYQISLNTENPRFVVRDLIQKTDSKMKWATVKTVLTKWLDNSEEIKRIMNGLAPLYAKYAEDGNIRSFKNVPPSFNQLFVRQAHETAYLHSVKAWPATIETNNFSILPTRCAGNTIWTKNRQTFHRITLDEKHARFERYTCIGTYLMTPTEFYGFMKATTLPKSKAFRKGTANEVSALLRQIYRTQQENVFTLCKMDQISLFQYQLFLANPNMAEQLRFTRERE